MPDAITATFIPAYKMLRWSRNGVERFKVAAGTYLDTTPIREVREHDIIRDEYIAKLVADGDMPEELEELATKAIVDTKHVFDRALYAACSAVGARPSGEASINFPWADSFKGCRGIVYGPKSKIPHELREAVLALSPHGDDPHHDGGSDMMRQLAKLANRKHTVDLGVSGLVNHLVNDVTMVNPPPWAGPVKGAQWDPVKREIVMARFPAGMYFQLNWSANVDICFDEPGTLMGAGTAMCLHLFADRAEQALTALEAHARALQE